MIPRYSRSEMVAIWSPETRFRIWFEIEAHAADAMAELGTVPKAAAKKIWAKGKKAGVTMNPATPVETIAHVIDLVDLVLVMSVNPGYGGQKYIPAATDKIRQVAALIAGRPIDLEIDGGITAENAALVTAAGANALVAGSAVFKGGPQAYRGNIAAIRQAAALARGEAG